MISTCISAIKWHVKFLVLLSFLSFHVSGQNIREEFTSNWEFTDAFDQHWRDAEVPGYVHLDLKHFGLIPDPYFADNEEKVQWVAQKDWNYRTEPFVLSSDVLSHDHIELVFTGIDTYAEIWFNGVKKLEVNNAHRSWRIDIKDEYQDYNNVVEIRIKSPIREGQKILEQQAHPLPGESIRAVTRKPQFHYGWDWGPKLTTSGIPGKIYLEAWSGATIRDLQLNTPIANEDSAVVEINYTISTDHTIDMTVAGSLTRGSHQSERFSTKVAVQPGTHSYHQTVVVKAPELWWTNDLGEQVMYDALVKIMGEYLEGKVRDSARQRFGIRSIELDNSPLDQGQRFRFVLNGVPIFAKGANYIPQDLFDTRVTADDYRSLLMDVSESNMNMLRVWGGGIYEDDLFYDLCDSLGILIWQDFMFACAMYPGDDPFAENVKMEAREQVRRLSSHPCIALWCGNNESGEGWARWGWQADLNKREIKKVEESYALIFHEILPAEVELNEEVTYWPSSPMLGRGDPFHQYIGDAHYWGVWHDAEPFSAFEEKVPRFMSEFGFQSFPEPYTLETAVPRAEWDTTSSILRAHEKHPRGFKLIDEYMQREYANCEDFEEWLYKSQLVQRNGIIKGIHAHRANAECRGSLYWQLNDCWTVASWSSIDYRGRWKALQYAAKEAFAPVAMWMTEDSLGVHLVVINDTNEEIHPEVEIKVIDAKGNTIRRIPDVKNSIGSGISRFKADHASADGEIYQLQWTINGETRSTLFFPNRMKSYQLPEAQLTYEMFSEDQLTWTVTVSADEMAIDIALYIKEAGKLSDNYFSLMPGESKTITFTAEQRIREKPEITLRSLN